MKAKSVWAILLSMVFGGDASATGEGGGVIAVNIALDPDHEMTVRAETVNRWITADYSGGFQFGPTYFPHITLVQRYVRVADLNRVYQAVERVLQGIDLAHLRLQATGYLTNRPDEVGSVVIAVEPDPELIRLHELIVEAIAPYAIPGGSAAAFFKEEGDSSIAPRTVKYVENFVPDSVGQNYEPHLTVGVATPESFRKLKAEPFEAFAFSPVAVSVYHLGNWGTCRKRLRTWRLVDR